MNISTLLKRGAFVVALGVAASAAYAQTFVYEGVIYKNASGKLTVQKPGTKTTVGDAAPDKYTGDIVVPETIVYDGTTYTVSSIGTGFAKTDIESLIINAKITTLSRGAVKDCPKLRKVQLPATLTKFGMNDFQNDSLLEEVNIPAGVSNIASASFSNCVGLKKIVVDESAKPLDLDATKFGGGALNNVEVMEIYRQIDGANSFGVNSGVDQRFGRGRHSLRHLVIGGSFTKIPDTYFENNPKLETVEIKSEIESMGYNAFAGAAIASFDISPKITAIANGVFQNCKNLTKVTMGDAVTSIGELAFFNTKLEQVTIPASVATIGQMAFSGTNLGGDLAFSESLTYIGAQAFANTKVSSVSLPASLKTLGDGAFKGCVNISKFTIADGNENYATDGKMLYSTDKKTLFNVAAVSDITTLTGDFEEIAAYAAFAAKGITSINLPKAKSFGDYCFSETGIESLVLNGQMGRFIAANSPALKSLTVYGGEVPMGVALTCTALTDVALPDGVAVVKSQAFEGCSALKSLNLGSILAIVEADAFLNSGIKDITLASYAAPGTAEGVFPVGCGITLTVPNDLVDTYKSPASGEWANCNVVGDANLAVGPSDMGMPAGLYYAGEDGNLHCVYADGNADTYDVGGVPHTFQLVQFKNRIYGASAGKTFTYTPVGNAGGGDGKLFYISKIGGNVFQATVLDNKDGIDYEDPFGLYIYGDVLYVNDRNVCIRKISANSIALPRNYKHWVENNWLSFYGPNWQYGCIKSGWGITKDQDAAGNPEPRYWVGMKTAGNGLYSFKEENVGTDSGNNKGQGGEAYMTSIMPIFTTFHIDEANDHIYMYYEAGTGTKKAGVYRLKLSDIIANPKAATFDDLNPVLIDGAPVAREGSDNERCGISQFSPDEKGEYLYWCSRAVSQKDAELSLDEKYSTTAGYCWAEAYDAANPRHQDCIKRIKLGEAQPEVEIVAKGVRGYGVVPVNFEGSKKPQDGVEDIIVDKAEKTLAVAGDIITCSVDAVVYVYDLTGSIVACQSVKAGEGFSVASLAPGTYIAAANGAALKFVK